MPRLTPEQLADATTVHHGYMSETEIDGPERVRGVALAGLILALAACAQPSGLREARPTGLAVWRSQGELPLRGLSDLDPPLETPIRIIFEKSASVRFAS
jgi:hypothetical protein